MAKEPTRIKMSETPSNKDVKKIPLPPLKHYDLEMIDDIYIKPDNDSIYTKINHENILENSTQSIQNLETKSPD